jgi:hypothetical protein
MELWRKRVNNFESYLDRVRIGDNTDILILIDEELKQL